MYCGENIEQMLEKTEMIIEGINHIRGFEVVKDAPEDTIFPTRASDGSAGYDFYCPEDIMIPARSFSKLIPLNIKAYMQKGEFLMITIRSSLAIKEDNGHLQVAQGSAIIDQDYYSNKNNDGNIGIMLENRTDKAILLHKGNRICQGIFLPFLLADQDTILGQREGGYGSSGK